MTNGLKIGSLELSSKVLAAPMAGVSDSSFRILCREFGAGAVYTEMVSAKALCFCDRKTAELLGNEKEQGTKGGDGQKTGHHAENDPHGF